MTYDGTHRDEDWFAVERPQPAKINMATYIHGRVFHDGGWWDASKGKPRIQVKRTAASDWEDLARLESYPETNAADHKNIADNAEFTVRFAPISVVGIRVIGAPASGNNPKQNFASCSELQGGMEK